MFCTGISKNMEFHFQGFGNGEIIIVDLRNISILGKSYPNQH
jgi:hypothetical protein